MSLVTQIKSDRIDAMKNKKTAKRSTLQLVLGQLENKKVELRLNTVEDLSDDQAQAVISTYIQSVDKAIAVYEKAGHSTEEQQAEKNVLLPYLPVQLTEEAIRSIVKPAIVSYKALDLNFGDAMKLLKTTLSGSANMSVVSRIAKEEFNK